jgi:hypothetical protein
MKKLIYSALLGMLLLNGCETSIQSKEDILDIEESPTESFDIEKVYAFNFDDLQGETICNPVTAEMLKAHSNNSNSSLEVNSVTASGNFTSKSGIRFAFSTTSNKGGVNGVGSLDLNGEDGYHLRYNINSLTISGKTIIFQGIITKSVNFSDKYNVGNSIIFNLEDKGSDLTSTDRYNAAVYSFSPNMDAAFYDCKAWAACGSDCFPEEYYLDIENGTFDIE